MSTTKADHCLEQKREYWIKLSGLMELLKLHCNVLENFDDDYESDSELMNDLYDRVKEDYG